jgi:hypothetical protein
MEVGGAVAGAVVGLWRSLEEEEVEEDSGGGGDVAGAPTGARIAVDADYGAMFPTSN